MLYIEEKCPEFSKSGEDDLAPGKNHDKSHAMHTAARNSE